MQILLMVGNMELTSSIIEKGDRDGYHDDRFAERRKDLVVEGSGGKISSRSLLSKASPLYKF